MQYDPRVAPLLKEVYYVGPAPERCPQKRHTSAEVLRGCPAPAGGQQGFSHLEEAPLTPQSSIRRLVLHEAARDAPDLQGAWGAPPSCKTLILAPSGKAEP